MIGFSLQERANKIRDSMYLLKKKRITPNQFLDRILFINKSIEKVEFPEDHLDLNESVAETVSTEHDASITSAPKGTCISCLSRICDIIFLPCFDIVLCSKCWENERSKHERECDALYRNNARKLTAEKKKRKCPCCSKIVKETKEFRMASVQF